MKVSITFKTPDAVSQAVDGLVEDKRAKLVDEGKWDENEAEYLAECLGEEFSKKFEKWIRYGEYVTIDFDTEAGTATVQETT